jgi:hypothetical protein
MYVDNLDRSGQEVLCSDCSRLIIVSETASGGTCSNCTQRKCLALLSDSERDRLFGVGASKSSRPARPRGWKWMKVFVDAKGSVYYKGVEQPKLKGTLPITDTAAIKAKQKENKAKRGVVENKKLLIMAAEKKALKKAIEKQKDFLNHKAGDK